MTNQCDVRGCGAHSYLKAERGTSDLYFCAHHGTERIDKLMLAGFNIVDDRGQARCECRACIGPTKDDE